MSRLCQNHPTPGRAPDAMAAAATAPPAASVDSEEPVLAVWACRNNVRHRMSPQQETEISTCNTSDDGKNRKYRSSSFPPPHHMKLVVILMMGPRLYVSDRTRQCNKLI